VYPLPAPPEGTVAETNLIDELHLTVRVPDDLTEDQVAAVRRTLASDESLGRLRRAVGDAFGDFPDLAPCRPTLSR
jgi:hypothetical protein